MTGPSFRSSLLSDIGRGTARLVGLLLPIAAWIAGAVYLGSWHPGWLALLFGLSSAALCVRFRRRYDLAAAAAGLVGGGISLLIGAIGLPVAGIAILAVLVMSHAWLLETFLT